MTSTDGRCVASTRWMPDARAFCASRAISSSTFLPTIIIMSASSSMITTMYGSGVRSGISRWSMRRIVGRAAVITGSRIGLPASMASFTLRLKPAMLRTPSADISL